MKSFGEYLTEELTTKKSTSGGHDVFYKGEHIGKVESKKVPWIRGKTITKITAKHKDGTDVVVKSNDKGVNTLESAKQSLLAHHLENSK